MTTRRRRVVAASLLAVLVSGLAWAGYRAIAGEPSARLADRWHRGHRVVDRDGRLLRELPAGLGGRGRPLALEEIGDRLVLATLVSEDKRFHEHDGVDLSALLRALTQAARNLRLVSGASTITQQLVKLLDHEGVTPLGRGLDDKLREAARAQNLERELSKSQILEAYLNRLGYGHHLIGPEAAARAMFGVASRDLSWAQAALLATLPRAPSYLDPYKHAARAVRRQRKLIDALHEAGCMSDADRARALAEPLVLQPIEPVFEAPHFVESLHRGALPGMEKARDGDVTTTTLELPLQRDVEGLTRTHASRLASQQASGAAVLVVDNASGEVLAYVGSPDWHADAAASKVDMARALRQPGSALKPFVYAMAFEQGTLPTEPLADVPAHFDDGTGVYTPENFSGSFLGPVPAREALAGSLNIPAIRLAARVGPAALLTRLHELGFSSLKAPAEHYGLSLALGSGEVTLLELARAYVTLARGGESLALRFVRGASAEGAQPARPLDAGAVAAVTDSLSDPLARVRGLGGRGPFDLGFPVAVKTGTSSGYRDSWTVGYTRERTVAVWIGNPDGQPTGALTGANGAGPLFADVMRRAMRDLVVHRPLWDDGLLADVRVCPISGLPVGDACPHAVERRVPKARLAATHGDPCELHRHAVARAGTWQCNEQARTVVVALPSLYDRWLEAQAPGAPGRDPFGTDWVAQSRMVGCGPRGPASLQIDDPVDGTVLLLARGSQAADQEIELAASFVGGTRGPARVVFLLDGERVAVAGPPYRAHVPARPGDHVLEVRPSDPSAPIGLALSRFSVR